MKYLDYDLIRSYEGTNFTIENKCDDVLFYCKDGFYSEKRYLDFMVDKLSGEYNSALVVGLGLGIIPQWLANEKGAVVDVIEKDNELVEVVTILDYLSESINLKVDDVFNHEQSKEYDLIVFDIWFDKEEVTEEVQLKLNKKYKANQIYYPLINKSYKI